MRTEAPTPDATRHRLLEGVLLRLARRPDAGGLAVRGGVLLRHWFRPLSRPALDLDLMAPSPLTVEEATRRHLPLFGEAAGDGVAFDLDRLRVEGIWRHTAHPGVRIHAHGAVGDDEADFQVDITGGPPPRPAAVMGELPTASGPPARVWVCRPEAVAGQKVQALWHLGMHGWRPKDLDDLRMLLERLPMDPAALREAIGAAFAEMSGTGDDARALFGASAWWGMKLSSARWDDFLESRGRGETGGLAGVVAGVCARLAPVLEGLP
jgi:Nucleotidyl transferase AbiEii toxin, Type IV TA system